MNWYKVKQQESDAIKVQIADFLKRGGKIEQIETGMGADDYAEKYSQKKRKRDQYLRQYNTAIKPRVSRTAERY